MNIVRLVGVYEDAVHMYIVLELLRGGELLERIRSRSSFTEAHAAGITAQLASAISHMHSRGVIHRDLKPEVPLFSICFLFLLFILFFLFTFYCPFSVHYSLFHFEFLIFPRIFYFHSPIIFESSLWTDLFFAPPPFALPPILHQLIYFSHFIISSFFLLPSLPFFLFHFHFPYLSLILSFHFLFPSEYLSFLVPSVLSSLSPFFTNYFLFAFSYHFKHSSRHHGTSFFLVTENFWGIFRFPSNSQVQH